MSRVIGGAHVSPQRVVEILRDVAYDVENDNAVCIYFEDRKSVERTDACKYEITVRVIAEEGSFTAERYSDWGV